MRHESTVVIAERELDFASAGAAIAALTADPSTSAATRITVDMHHVEFLDAYAIGILLALRSALAARQCDVRLINLNRMPLRVLSVTGLLDLLCAGPDPRG